jgi:hypothetical protein
MLASMEIINAEKMLSSSQIAKSRTTLAVQVGISIAATLELGIL